MDEVWDVYDVHMKRIGRKHPRGRPLTYGEYHVVVFAWAVREDGKILMTKRAPQKSYSGFYECTGGCAFAGETPRQAAAREMLEETGLTPETGDLVRVCRRVDDFAFTYVFQVAQHACPRPQSGETAAPEWLSVEQYESLLWDGRVVPSASNLPALLQALKSGHPIFEALLPDTQIEA